MTRRKPHGALILAAGTLSAVLLSAAGCERYNASQTCAQLIAATLASPSGIRGALARRAADRENCYAEDFYDATQ
jgi:hypothetical protein